MRFKRDGKHRSGYETDTTAFMKTNGIKAEYEPKDKKLKYIKPASNHTYQIDYVLDNQIHLECKGLFSASDRKKILLIKEQYPHIDLRMVFMQPSKKLSKISKTTYAMWCDKNSIKWGVMKDILAWSKERP